MAEPPDRDHQEAMLDEALDESFPASDPPSITRPHDPGQMMPRPPRGDRGRSGDVTRRGR